MEENKNLNTETNTEEGTPTETADAELFAKLDEILEKRSKSIIKSVLKDNGTEDAEIGEILGRYKASKQTARTKAEETLSTLQTRNAELTKKLFNIELDKAAEKAAAEIGMSREKLQYAMKLANTTEAVKDGKIDNTLLKSALEDVLKNIPEFKAKAEEPTNNSVRKVGVENKEPETEDALSKMRKALGLPENK